MKPLGKSYHGNFMELHYDTRNSLLKEKKPCICHPLGAALCRTSPPISSLADLEINQKQRWPLRPTLKR